MADEVVSQQPTTSNSKELLPLVRQLENSADDAVSPKGAIGRYQITSDTARTYGLDPSRLKDPAYNEFAATTILNDLHRRYNGNTNDILTAYNAGPHRADQFVAGGRRLSSLPGETQAYLNRASSILGAQQAKPADTSGESQASATPSATIADEPPEPAQVAQLEHPEPPKIMQFMAKARAAGYSQSDLDNYTNTFKQKAVEAGYSPNEIAEYLGLPPGQISTLGEDPVRSVALYVPRSIGSAAQEAWQTLRDDAIKKWKMDQPGAIPSGFWDEQKHQFDSLMATGKVAKDAFNLAISPFTGVMNVAQTGIAKGLTASREFLGLTTGKDFKPMTHDEIENESMSQAGQMLLAVGPKGGIGSAVALPKMGEIVDAATSIATAKSADGAVHAIHTEAENLGRNYVKTGEPPVVAAMRAQQDPVFRTEMQLPLEPEHLPDGSSVTPIEEEFTGQKAPGFQRPVGMTDIEAAAQEGKIIGAAQGFKTPSEINASAEFNFTRYLEEHPEIHEGDFIVPRIPSVANGEEMVGGAGGQPPGGEPPAEGPKMIEGPEPGKMKYANPWEVVGKQIAVDNSTWLGRLSRNAGSFYRQMFSPEDPINQLMDRVMKGGPLPDEANGAMLNRLASNWRNKAFTMIGRDMIDVHGQTIGPSLVDIAKGVKAKETGSRTFDRYAYAKWAVEKASQAKETGVEVDAAKQIVDEVEGPQGIPVFQKGFADIMQWRNSTLAYARDKGLISSDAYDDIVEANKAGIPGYRWFDEEEQVTKGGTSGKTVSSPVKKFFGSERQVKPLWQSLAQDAMRRVQMAEQNVANLSIFNMAKDIGEATATVLKKPAELDPATWHDIDQEEYVEDLGNPTYPHDTTEARKKSLVTWTGKFGLKADEVPMFDRGQPMRVKFADPHITEYLRGYDSPGSMSVLRKMVSGLTRFTRAAIVNNPMFATGLAGYDVVWQFIKTPGFRNTAADFMAGLGQRMGSDGWEKWYRSGGAEGVYHQIAADPEVQRLLKYGTQDPTWFDGMWNTVKTPFHWVKIVSQDIMNMQKAGRFYRGIAQGEGETRAAVASTEAAFHRSGFGGVPTKAANQIVPFTGAILNGLEQTIRGQLGIGRMVTGEQRSGINFTIKAAAAITVPTLATWAAYRNEDWYKARPDYQKDNGIFIRVGDTTYYFKYPPLVSLIYAALPRRLMEKYANDNPQAFKNLPSSLMEAAIPPAGTSAFGPAQPLVEHLANYSFFKGQPIVPDSLKSSTLPAYQYTKYSTATAKALAKYANDIPLLKHMNLSAPVIDNYIQQWLGIGNTAIHATEMALQNAGIIRRNAPSMSFSDLPGFSRFIARNPGANAQPIREFYDAIDHFNQVHGSVQKAINDGDLDGLKSLLSENATAAIMHRTQLKGEVGQAALSRGDFPQYQSAMDQASSKADPEAADMIMRSQKLMKQFNDRVKLIDALPEKAMSPSDKRQQQDMIYGQMQVVAQRALQWMDRAGMRNE